MIAIFGVLVWVPLVLSDPHNHTNWSETAETFALPEQHGFSLTVWVSTSLETVGRDDVRCGGDVRSMPHSVKAKRGRGEP